MKKTSAFHKNPALWLVILVPVSAVIVGLSMLAVSIYTFDGPVVDDYYKKGKEINFTLQRDKMASDYELFAELIMDQDKEVIEMELSANDRFEFPANIELNFLHRTLSGKDQKVELVQQSDGLYQANLPALSQSRWLVELGAADWRLTGAFVWPVESTFELDSQSIN